MASVVPLPRSLTQPGGAYFLPHNQRVSRTELERRDQQWRRMREIGHARARLRLESEPGSSNNNNNQRRPTTSNGNPTPRIRTSTMIGVGGIREEGILNDDSIYQAQSVQRQRSWDDDATLVGTTRGIRQHRERLLMEQVREMEREEERERQRRRNGNSSPNGNQNHGIGIWRRWWRRE